jgi:hypothetical protein
MTRKLLASDAWRSARINTRRLVEFLLLEHMSNGGKENGRLKAPHRQLEAFGIAARLVAAAIRDAERLGLVACHRRGMKVASLYTITWLPHRDGSPATNRWQAYRNPALTALIASKIEKLPSDGRADLPYKMKVDRKNLSQEGKADDLKTLPHQRRAPSRKGSYQGGNYKNLSRRRTSLIVANDNFLSAP